MKSSFKLTFLKKKKNCIPHCILNTYVKEDGGVKIDYFGPRSAECDRK